MKPHLLLSLFIVTIYPTISRGEKLPSGLYYSKQFDVSAIQILTDIPYGEKVGQGGRRTKLLVDLFLPPNASEDNRQPLIILIHGGGFRNGVKEKHHDWAAEYATLGYVAVCINYRLTPESLRDKSPANFITAATHATEDGMDAIRFLKLNAVQYGIDPNRIATIGMSAGGWISTLNGIDSDNFNGVPSSFPGITSQVQAAIATGVSFADDDTCKYVRDSLMRFDQTDTPILLFHAEEKDRVTTAPWSEAVYLKKLITDSGNTCELYQQPGDRHVDNMSPSGPYWGKIAPFLMRHLDL